MIAGSSSIGRFQAAATETVRRIRGARPTGVREELEELEAVGAWGVWLRDLLRDTPSWLVSSVVHLVVLLMLALWVLPGANSDNGPPDLVFGTLPEEPVDPDDPDEQLPSGPITFGSFDGITAVIPKPKETTADYVPSEIPSDLKFEVGLDPFTGGVPFGDPLAPVGPPGGGGDVSEWRKRIEHSPVAAHVTAALRWLAAHQLPDGSWSFNHCRAASCAGQCSSPGSLDDARIGATGLALLPFLGAAQTHKRGTFKKTVGRGLYYLANRMKLGPNGGSFHEKDGRMYSHGIAAIALCEAYALSKDKGLQVPAQQALNFICYAQDPVGGGWRYEPRQRGDTSVVGWQLMALKSGRMSYLLVPDQTLAMARRYLDGVQFDSGARYGYTDSGRGSAATTAIGLLCRMYLGWNKSEPGLQRGVEWIGERGPDPADMYYNYYATQVMRHWEGSAWRKWDAAMKPQLVESQGKDGHEQGSWIFKHSHADRGGRLYCTAMAAMTLEVYYRDLPIYRRQSVEFE